MARNAVRQRAAFLCFCKGDYICHPFCRHPSYLPPPRPPRRPNVSAGPREPLFHFILIGAVLFGVDALIASRTDDPHHIQLDAEADAEIQRMFASGRGREPNADELRALRQVWLDNEVLYREGLALGLDKGDTAIRERVIFKALSMVDANAKRPPYDEKVLREWFEKNRVRYDTPERFNFQEAVLAGDSSEAAVRAFRKRVEFRCGARW